MAVQQLKNFMNLPSGKLSEYVLSLLGAEQAAFVLVSPDGRIATQTAGAARLLQSQMLCPVGELLSERAAHAVQQTLLGGGRSILPEEIDGKPYDLEILAVPEGALLYFQPQQAQRIALPGSVYRRMNDAIGHILMASRLLHEDAGRDRAEIQLLEGIERDGLRLQRSLTHLSLLQSQEVPELSMHLQSCDLRELCKWLIEHCSDVCRLRGREVAFSLDAPSACWAVCDRKLILRAVLNLLVNAVQGPAVTKVELHLQHEKGRVRITVRDNGSGMADETAARVYDGWLRPQEDWMTAADTGLGLPVARQIAGWHGGTLLLTQSKTGGVSAALNLPDDLHADPPQLGQPDERDADMELTRLELSVL